MVAVTAAAGPVGRALVRALLARMDEPGTGAAPTRVIAIDSQERIDRLVLSIGPTGAAEAAGPSPELTDGAPGDPGTAPGGTPTGPQVAAGSDPVQPSRTGGANRADTPVDEQADPKADAQARTAPAPIVVHTAELSAAEPLTAGSAAESSAPASSAPASSPAQAPTAGTPSADTHASDLKSSDARTDERTDERDPVGTAQAGPGQGGDEAPAPVAGRSRRRSYLPAGLASTLAPSRREPREKETADGTGPDPEPSTRASGRSKEKPVKERSGKERPTREPADAVAPSVPELGIVPGVDTGVVWCPADISSPDVVGALDSADIVIHLAAVDDLGQAPGENPSDRRLRAVRAAQAVSMAAAAVGARRLVAVTSAMVLGARPDNPEHLADDATCRAEPDDGLIGDLLEVERVLERIPRVHPGLAFTLIRPAALVGPGVDTSVTRHFEASRLLVLRGTGTRWQFCHLDDLGAAIWTAVTEQIDGPLTVGAADALEESQVEAISGMRRLEVPAGLAFSTAEQLNRVGVLNTPAAELAYVVHPWVVGSTGLLAAGWRARYDNESCLRGLLEDQRRRRSAPGRRPDRRDAAAMGAAGVAVALLGTAAIVRQARSRQSRRRRSTLDP